MLNKTIPWGTLALLSLLSLGLVANAAITPFLPTPYTYGYILLTSLYPLLVTILSLRGSFALLRRSNLSVRGAHAGRRFSPFLLGVNMAVFMLSQVIGLLYFVTAHEEAPFLSPTYYTIFGIYPFIIGAILLLPAREVSPLARLRILLDSLIIIVALAALCSYFVLAPILSKGDGTLLEKVIGTLFPTLDLVVLFCVLLVAQRSEEPALRPVLILLALASLSMAFIHINRLKQVLNDEPHWLSSTSLGWTFGLMLMFGAAQVLKNMLNREGSPENVQALPEEQPDTSSSCSRSKSLLSLILVLVISLLIFALWLAGVEKIFQGQIAIIYVGGFLILMLIVLRQVIALYEIGVLRNKLQKRNRALSLLNDLLERQAITDSLTGLPNHREIMARLEEALAEARETTSNCALVFMDLDHFKDINDRYGHLVGDAVLCEFSERVLAALRANDYLGRWGGEEFIAVLPGVEAGEALRVAERIRLTIDQHIFADETGVHLTCSLGVVSYPDDATSCEDLIRNADRAMYAAKRLGRNQTRTASEPLVLAMGMLAEAPETAEEAEMLAVVESLIAALEVRDHETGRHARRVAALSLKLALALDLNGQDACIIAMGGLLHDLGKVAMPDAILFKRGKLSAVEVEYMNRHPVIGADILGPLASLREVAAVVRAHHEWFNGTGYPAGLSGEQIPLGARIVAVADSYDAIISHRVYRQGRGSPEAVRELRGGTGQQFDPRVVAALESLLAVAPLESLLAVTPSLNLLRLA
ncbi:MAG TPA: diguanylate cyclase [Ktedonobacteraceae bacterium]